jgi:pimeloyl-ACP methyl ester carboxylesterase
MIPDSEIILIHGLWFGSWAMKRLHKRLSAAGYSVRRFSYKATRQELSGHARELCAFAGTSRQQRLHLVAHSLGGLLVLRAMKDCGADLPPGRIVMLGTPLKGSAVVRRLARMRASKKMFGDVLETLEEGTADVSPGRETGMIAVSRKLGLGLLTGGLGGASDGTVAVSETQWSGLTDHIALRVSHTGLIYSKKVVRQIVLFLESGRFEPS